MTLEEHHERLAHAARNMLKQLTSVGHLQEDLLDEVRTLLATPHAEEECADAMLRDACQTLAQDVTTLLAPIEAALAQDGGGLEDRTQACAAIRARLAPVTAAEAEMNRTRAVVWTVAVAPPAVDALWGPTRKVGWFLTLRDAKRFLAKPAAWRPGEALAVIERVASGDLGCHGGRWFRAEVDPATGRRRLRPLDTSTCTHRSIAFVMG